MGTEGGEGWLSQIEENKVVFMEVGEWRVNLPGFIKWTENRNKVCF
jgi:hypothetical protein